MLTQRCALTVATGAMFAVFASSAWAYNCGGRPWQSVLVEPSYATTATSTAYTIQATVPTLAGCNATTSTEIDIAFPSDTVVSPSATGTVNGNSITNFLSRSGTTVAFLSPVAVATNQTVAIVLQGITNPTSPGSKTLTVVALHTSSGGPIGQTTSASYVIVVPSLTPTSTNSPTDSPTATATPSRPARARPARSARGSKTNRVARSLRPTTWTTLYESSCRARVRFLRAACSRSISTAVRAPRQQQRRVSLVTSKAAPTPSAT